MAETIVATATGTASVATSFASRAGANPQAPALSAVKLGSKSRMVYGEFTINQR